MERYGALGDLTKKTIQIEFLIDDSKAENIAKKLISEFDKRKGIFQNNHPQEYVLPRKITEGSREHALFLTYVMSINYMTGSEQLWKKSRAAYALFPERFYPDQILKTNPHIVENFVKYLGASQYVTGAKTWAKVSKILADNYENDPRNITKEPLRIQDIQNRLKPFPYLRGTKLSNQYIRVMGEAGLFKIKNPNQLNIPIDKQVARFTIYTGILKLISKRFVGSLSEDPFKELLEEVWKNAVKPKSVAPWKLHSPICTVESTLCADRGCKRCPVDSYCEKKRKGISFKEDAVFWSATK